MSNKDFLNKSWVTVPKPASQEGQTTEASRNDAPNKSKKLIIAGLVFIGILSFLALGIRGIAFTVGLTACGWLIFCTVKRKPKKVPAIVAILFLTIAFAVPGPNAGNMTQKQLMKNLSDIMEPVGYQLVSTDNMSDNSYLIYVKDSPDDTPRPNGIQCKITEESGHVKSIILISASGSKGIPMSAMKFVSALNPTWSSDKVTAVVTKALKGETVYETGITYTFENYGASSRFLIGVK